MTVFKAYLKILNRCKFVVILYTVLLVFFGGFNMQTSENTTNFVASKPDILIINNDKKEGVTKNLIEYIQNNSNIIDIKKNNQAINDALFYRDINYIIYIPENYRNDFLNGNNPEIQVKSTGDYQASLAEMLLQRYLGVASTYQKTMVSESDLINKINDTLAINTEVEITSKLDTNNLSRATFYYNFMNYSLFAGAVYVICLILSSFKEVNIHKRTVISSMNFKKYNRDLLLSNSLFAYTLWLIYVILSFILVGPIMFTMNGLLYIINSFIFNFCVLTIAVFIGNLVTNKNAINGIVNVVAIGTSFLCGSFVPVAYLPDMVLKIAHILPSYYYTNNNELIGKMEIFNFDTLRPFVFNVIIILVFIIIFVIFTNIISRKKRKIG